MGPVLAADSPVEPARILLRHLLEEAVKLAAGDAREHLVAAMLGECLDELSSHPLTQLAVQIASFLPSAH